MVKSHKQELLALLGTMGQMADLLPKLENPAEQIQDLQAACECLLENLEGENSPECLSLLQSIETALKENLNVLDLVKKLESAFKSEVKTDLEVLFLPYKASMWDSLESVYLAAKESPNCEALVMPIPYYDKKDGKFTEMHWETGYPKGIPLIDYNKYSIAERRPDIIFIHNPYDDCNIVTSVHPDYYSEKLRNLTKCLVYVPYFVGSGTHIQEHFCTLPGCIYAHKVIVQTEQEREIYAREYRKSAAVGVAHRGYPNSPAKFLALGSPKLDKAISAKREDYEIPAEWSKILSEPRLARIKGLTGFNKRIIFYNTTIGALLQHTIENNKPSSKYLQKIRSVFEFFKNREDAVLLWRPHPLLESTIKSMRPWLEQEYAEIVREYKSGGWGIYDDTPDLNRAVAVSDAYYGDGGSVVNLFDTVGKRVVWQAFGMPAIAGLLDDGDFVWALDCYNMLYKYDKQSKETECMRIIPAQNHWANLRIAANNGKLYFAPHYKNDKIFVFDTIQKNFEQIDFKDGNKYDRNFHYPISFKNFVYFIPYDYPAIMRLNTDTKEMEYFSEWISEVSKLQVHKLQHEVWKDLKFWDFCVVGTEIALVIHRANALMFFDMETGNYEIRSVGEKSEQYYSICFDGQDYYLSSFYKDYIVKWNRQTNGILKIKIPSFSRKESVHANFSIQHLNEYIWLFPFVANNAYKINTDTNEITKLPELIEHFEDKNIGWYYNQVSVSESTIYASTLNKGIVEYNTSTSELNFIKLPSNSEINALLNYKKELETSAKTANSGKKIWEAVK
ncbi:MAG: hypothetical protein LBC85_01225 [Fibromonadaceae bacterium]|jgi:hypothetical protein|nr:hypothetical protein [Fibromonadaceae bacterium]